MSEAADVYRFTPGDGPLLVSFPHDGTGIPPELERRMTPAALRRPDTDWHVARLYEFCGALGITTLVAKQSRYVVDLNRDPDGTELYPGADNTGLCPTSTFDREPIYQAGQEPSPDEILARTETHFLPYHCALAERIADHVARFGIAVVLDAHSIRSQVPRFFEGTLPDLNLGTASGKSSDDGLSELAFAKLTENADYVAVRDGRFKGGYITRHYGNPTGGVSALQLELAQKNYMDERHPFAFDETKAMLLRAVLRPFVEALADWANQRVRS